MVTITKAFTATGTGPELLLRGGDSVTYALSGTFVATLTLEYTGDQVSWTPILTTTSTVASTTFIYNAASNCHVNLRWRCSSYDSGTATTTIVEVGQTLTTFSAPSGAQILSLTEDGIVVTGTASVSGVLTPGGVSRASQKYQFKAGSKVGGTSGWVVAAADNVHLITLPASQTGSKLIFPISGLKVGSTITSFHLVGQIESGGNTVTVDADLRKQTAAAADVTDASIGTITQLSVTADTIMSSSNTSKTLATAEVIGDDETFYIVITATTGASTDIALQGVCVVVTEA